jgi:hypothetical protein
VATGTVIDHVLFIAQVTQISADNWPKFLFRSSLGISRGAQTEHGKESGEKVAI